MKNAVNWTLVGIGGLLIVAEVVLGAATGFDLALMGVALAVGGAIGLFFASTKERAEIMRRLEVLNHTLGQNTKYIVPSNASLVNILGLDSALPLATGKGGAAAAAAPPGSGGKP